MLYGYIKFKLVIILKCDAANLRFFCLLTPRYNLKVELVLLLLAIIGRILDGIMHCYSLVMGMDFNVEYYSLLEEQISTRNYFYNIEQPIFS